MSIFSLIKISPLKILFITGIFSIVLIPSLAQSNSGFKKGIGQNFYALPKKLKENHFYINFGGNQFQLTICHNANKIIDSTGKDFILFYYPKYLTGNTVIRKINSDFFSLKINIFRKEVFEYKLNYLNFLSNISSKNRPKIITNLNNGKFVFSFDVSRSNKNQRGMKWVSKTILINPIYLQYGLEIYFFYLTNEDDKCTAKPIVRLPQFEYQL